jgi:hypothetical protein
MKVTIDGTALRPYNDFPRERKYTIKLFNYFPVPHSEIFLNNKDGCVLVGII